MFRDVTLDKLLYDLFIALLTGIVAGVLTGFWVDRRIRQRESQRLSLATNIMYVEVIEAVNQLTKDILPDRFISSVAKMCEFSDSAAAYSIVELTDQTIFDIGAPSRQALEQEFAKSLASLQSREAPIETDRTEGQTAKLQPLGSTPPQMEPLTKAKQRLDDVFQRHGFILDPELRELLAALSQHLVKTLQFGDWVPDWTKKESRTIFTDFFIQVLQIADKIRCKLYGLGKTLSWDDLIKRIG